MDKPFAIPLSRLTFPAPDLIAAHPPRLHDRNKQIVFQIACSPGANIAGEVIFTRWAAMPLPAHLDLQRSLEIDERESIYDYARSDSHEATHWHVNFADPSLFFGYGTGLFAQDEMQVAEHPVLASLLEALRDKGESTQTVERSSPTPVLVRGAERRVQIATGANANQGRPQGLYGNRFAVASAEAIRRATTRIDPPTISNLIAIAAPSSGSGRYSIDDIQEILTIAYTGFRAAVFESAEIKNATQSVVIHTGFWGCGAFGGNRVLMPLLQLIAARLANVDRLVFYSVDPAGSSDFGESLRVFDELKSKRAKGLASLAEVIESIHRLGLEWGFGDGT